ncbi:MAG: cyclic nucleotide-binding domain-containing protein [Alphaproteobacteria bacterium]|nr:cyclic nucleotide-binding domain-containing protein [Alphaproteobacteria bacterium]
MVETVTIQRPRRWDVPFSDTMDEAEVSRILGLEPFRGMDRERFPETLSLDGIIANDTRVVRFQDGDIVMREGDYGNSAFLVITGEVRVVLPPGLPEAMLGRAPSAKKSLFQAIAQLWRNPAYPEVRSAFFGAPDGGTASRDDAQQQARIFIQDIRAVFDQHRTAALGPADMFGEIAALGRTQRTATVISDGPSELLEIRWQGLRDIRRRVDDFRRHVDRLYRERSLTSHLQAMPMFQRLDAEAINRIADETVFETYGDFDWHTQYQRQRDESFSRRLAEEPIIVAEGDYPDGLLLVRAGFGRVSRAVNNGHRTIRYIGRGAVFGMAEIIHNWRHDDGGGVVADGVDDDGGAQTTTLQSTLRALGYVDILRVPTAVIEELVLPTLSTAELALYGRLDRDRVSTGKSRDDDAWDNPVIDPGMLEFLVEHRYINGTATMLMDLGRCVRCDECVLACARAHDNNPRFNRHGRRHGNYMVANACMHCMDPVCMIGCPTGAIHRSSSGGQVTINDLTCIGCATCANSCPYDNIRMVEVRDGDGAFIRDTVTKLPIAKATKCDLCLDQLGGPACARACPHDALKRVDMQDLTDLGRWLNR